MQLILASGSPRRRELLATLVSDFIVISSDIEEIFNHQLPGIGEQVCDLALQKALAVAQKQSDDCLVIGADTIVYLEGVVLGKPSDADDAERMLAGLSGKSHQVITGVGLVRKQDGSLSSFQGFTVSQVRMRAISPQERADYIASGEPMDKAGAYAIQGGAGRFVEKVEGSYENIVGLPLELMRDLLTQAGWTLT
ncbi:MAG: nucleoside triphosphate pyrophosphatase [Candidatus Sericytochromatia bacterium]